jgi:ribonuclease HII
MSRSQPQTAKLSYEQALWAQGCRCVVGLDEAGRGAWAGPVSAGAVVLPPARDDLRAVLEGVRDSKQMTARSRVRLIERIQTTALGWGIGWAEASEIDQIGIVPATCQAMTRALDDLRRRFPALTPDYLLLDSIRWHELDRQQTPHRALVRGDSLSLTIAAASILAKVWRDERMIEYDQRYPLYGFAHHKGYGVPEHAAALREHGASQIHRMTFRPMSQRQLL